MKIKFSIIIVLLILVIQTSYLFSQAGNKITLEDIYLNRKYAQTSAGPIFHLNDGEHFAMPDRQDNIIRYAYFSGEVVDTIFNSNDFYNAMNDSVGIDNLELSKNQNWVIISTQTERLYRRSSKAVYYLWNNKEKTLTKLSDTGKQRIVTLSPNEDMAGYIIENNIYIKNLTSGEETQITFDGEYNKIINGAPDWVYEEEFSMTRAYCWSKEGDKIAFLKFDESNVKEFELTFYGNTYPETKKFKYPKAGEENSKLELRIYDINSKKLSDTDIEGDKDFYFPSLKWTESDDLISLVRLNRLQNYFELIHINAETGELKIILTEQSITYLNEVYDITYLKDNSFIRLSESDGFKHLYLYDKEGKLINQITKGEWEVKYLIDIDEGSGIVYYSSNEPSPLESSTYSIKLDGNDRKKLSDKSGYNYTEFSKNFSYYINNHSDAYTPLSTVIYDIKGKMIKTLEDNLFLKIFMALDGFVEKEFFKFKTSSGIELNGWIMKPPKIVKGKKYPLLMYVYGGNGSQSVLNSFGGNEYFWGQFLCQNGYIIACVDGRATGGRGEKFEKCNYLNMGTVEIEDQIEAVKYLGSLDYIDKKRIGIWGWSHGGYITTLCMTKASDYFKTGIAVASVTDWRYYDNIYTERFMRTPEENPDGYRNSSPITYADKLKGKLLLIHGSVDDNVHFQNTMDFVNELIKCNKQFEMMIYPNKNHNISGGNTRYHLFYKMTDFIFRNL